MNFSITFLGTSAAAMSPLAATSAYLVGINQNWILVDAGMGVLRQLRKVKVRPEDVNIILITHWHIDHYAGLPAVLKAKGKLDGLSIYGPALPFLARVYLTALFRPIGKMVEIITEGFFRNYADFLLQAIPNSHTIDSYGWVITEKPQHQANKERKIVISGDTRPAENIFEAARNADLLVHEATYLENKAQTAFLHGHSTAGEAAEIAVKSGAGALALTHIPKRHTRTEAQAEAQKIFASVFVPAPLETFYVDPLPDRSSSENSGWARIRIKSSL